MPPNRSPLDEHRAEIEELYKSGLTHDELLNTINSRHGAQFSITTLQRRLSAWGVNKGEGRRRTRVKNDELAVIQARVYAMMASHTDQQIFEVLSAENFEIGNVRTIRRIRKQMGVYRRHEQNDEEYDESLKAIVRQEMENGNVAKYGRRRYLWQYLKDRGMVVARTRLIRIVQEVDPEGQYRCDRENNKGGRELGSLRHGRPHAITEQVEPTYGQTVPSGKSPAITFPAPLPDPTIDPAMQHLPSMIWSPSDSMSLDAEQGLGQAHEQDPSVGNGLQS